MSAPAGRRVDGGKIPVFRLICKLDHTRIGRGSVQDRLQAQPPVMQALSAAQFTWLMTVLDAVIDVASG
jgi:hypothetical protein